MVRRQLYYKCTFLIVICTFIVCLAGLVGCPAPGPPPTPTPVNMISTTLNPDGLSGANYFEASWSLEAMTLEEAEVLLQSVEAIRSKIESLFDARPITWIDPAGDLLILETKVDFHDPVEIEGILAIIYGLGYARPDISIKILGPYYTELETSWFIEMTINPEHIPCIEDFRWKVNMPAEITDVTITPDDANVRQSSLGSNTLEFTFEPYDQFITVSVTAEEVSVTIEESNGSGKFWPIVTEVVAALIAAGMLALIGLWIAKRRQARQDTEK